VESWLKSPEYRQNILRPCFHTNGCRSLANWQHLLHYAVVFTTLVGFFQKEGEICSSTLSR
jgi:hypothetical protein